MNTRMTVDTRGFERDLRKIMALTKKSAEEAIRQQSKLLVQDCIKMTPPFAGQSMEGVTNQSYAQQREAGRSAVTRDIKRLFVVGANLPEAREPWARKALEKWKDAGNSEALNKILSRMKVSYMVAHEGDSLATLHAENRNKRTGRVFKKARVLLLGSSRANIAAINRYVKEACKHVGKAKSGWVKAANALGLKRVPKWITGAEGQGIFSESFTNGKAEVIVGNGVPYIQASGRDLKVIEKAFVLREGKLKADIENRLEAMARKAR
jgi:hypothetical protein